MPESRINTGFYRKVFKSIQKNPILFKQKNNGNAVFINVSAPYN